MRISDWSSGVCSSDRHRQASAKCSSGPRAPVLKRLVQVCKNACGCRAPAVTKLKEKTMTLNMTSPLEVGIACRDLVRLRHFYEQVLGFAFISQYQVPADKSAESGLSEGGYTVVRLQTSNGERIKRLAPVKPVPAQDPRSEERREGKEGVR